MKLANIVSSSSVNVSEDFNVVKTMDKIIHGVPTLIVGYDLVNSLFPDFDITTMYLGDNMYWTFKRTERRDQFQEDLLKFTSKIYKDLTNDISYIFVDPIQYQSKAIRKIIRKILSSNEVISYVNGDMIYIYADKIIFGVDFKLLRYMGINTTRITDKIKCVSTEFLSNNEILIEYKSIIESLNDKVMYVPYLYSIRNGKNDIISLIHLPRKDRVVS